MEQPSAGGHLVGQGRAVSRRGLLPGWCFRKPDPAGSRRRQVAGRNMQRLIHCRSLGFGGVAGRMLISHGGARAPAQQGRNEKEREQHYALYHGIPPSDVVYLELQQALRLGTEPGTRRSSSIACPQPWSLFSSAAPPLLPAASRVHTPTRAPARSCSATRSAGVTGPWGEAPPRDLLRPSLPDSPRGFSDRIGPQGRSL